MMLRAVLHNPKSIARHLAQTAGSIPSLGEFKKGFPGSTNNCFCVSH